jgi:hypothetical protein
MRFALQSFFLVFPCHSLVTFPACWREMQRWTVGPASQRLRNAMGCAPRSLTYFSLRAWIRDTMRSPASGGSNGPRRDSCDCLTPEAEPLPPCLKQLPNTPKPRPNGIPSHLLAVDVKPQDYEWTHTAETPAEPTPHTVQPTIQPKLFEPALFNENIHEWSKRYVASLLSNPAWHAENERRVKEKAARNQARLERIEERRRSKEEVKG